MEESRLRHMHVLWHKLNKFMYLTTYVEGCHQLADLPRIGPELQISAEGSDSCAEMTIEVCEVEICGLA